MIGKTYGNLCDADLNQDCVVNFLDLGVLSGVFFSNDPVADLSGDGNVNFLDPGNIQTLFFCIPGPSAGAALCNAQPS